jgi:hypothetical protein
VEAKQYIWLHHSITLYISGVNVFSDSSWHKYDCGLAAFSCGDVYLLVSKVSP